MANYIINGGKKLNGTIETKTAKNSAIACMCACLLTDQKLILKDVPKIDEVYSLIKVLSSIGVKVNWLDRTLILKAPKKLKLNKIDFAAAIKTRIILLLIGALAHREKKFKIPRAGGCKLGKRTVTSHLFGLQKLGIKIHCDCNYYWITAPENLKGNRVVMYESGDTPTENVIFAAVMAKGITEIVFASSNYMVQDLCCLLKQMGSKVFQIGITSLRIEGVKNLHGTEYPIMPDPIESMFWISLAATTKSDLTIRACPKNFVELELLKLEKMGFKYKILKTYKSKNGYFDLIDIKTKNSKLLALDDKIDARPYPGLNIDNLPFFIPVATQAKGTTLIHDWCYENRAIYYMEFQKLGASMNLADPHRVFINGPTELKPNEIVCPPALRPATILVIGMIAARGKSILRNTYSIDRGYENLYGRLKKIGVDIKETA